PPALAKHITQEDFEQSQEYGKDNAKFTLSSKTFSQRLDSAPVWILCPNMRYSFP
ncbi:hypothetical protein K435DRAFT_651299, partial [Dendrothele bispora CBS 962.96]